MNSSVPYENFTMNKASNDGIPALLFLILIDNAVTQNVRKFGKFSSDHTARKVVFILIPKKDNGKEYSNYHTVVLISHISKVLLKNPSW